MGCAASTAKGEVRGFVFLCLWLCRLFSSSRAFFFNDDVNDDDESLFVVSSDLNRIGFPDDHRIVQFC